MEHTCCYPCLGKSNDIYALKTHLGFHGFINLEILRFYKHLQANRLFFVGSNWRLHPHMFKEKPILYMCVCMCKNIYIYTSWFIYLFIHLFTCLFICFANTYTCIIIYIYPMCWSMIESLTSLFNSFPCFQCSTQVHM